MDEVILELEAKKPKASLEPGISIPEFGRLV